MARLPRSNCRRKRRVGRRTAPLRGKQYASNVCRLLSAFVVGPELERALVVRYRAGP
jgi:hypothetical protein